MSMKTVHFGLNNSVYQRLRVFPLPGYTSSECWYGSDVVLVSPAAQWHPGSQTSALETDIYCGGEEEWTVGHW